MISVSNASHDQDPRVMSAITYAKSLINVPYRWYDESIDIANPDDQFWCKSGPAPDAKAIILEDKSIVCTGLINLMRRHLWRSVPKHDTCPGGTVAWVNYLSKKNCLKPIDINAVYPAGTLLIKKYENAEDQGHVAVMLEDSYMIHACADVPYKFRHMYKNHGYVRVEKYYTHYFTHVCDADDWLLSESTKCLPE